MEDKIRWRQRCQGRHPKIAKYRQGMGTGQLAIDGGSSTMNQTSQDHHKRRNYQLPTLPDHVVLFLGTAINAGLGAQSLRS